MQPRLNRNERTDAIDYEQFKDMLASQSFAVLRKRILAELERASLACERSAEVRELRRSQGAAAALRSVLALPEQILNEMRVVSKSLI